MRRFHKLIALTTIGFFSVVAVNAQELNAKITVLHPQIQGVDAKVFNSMQSGLQNLLNNRKWTSDNYKNNEKYDCSFVLNLTGHTQDNTYTGSITVQASRPVYNATYTSPVMNYIDRDIQFKYEDGQSLTFDDNRISGADALASNLTALMAYYTYFILGLEYDSFSLEGGSDMFNKARNVVMNAPDDNKTISGWKANDNTKDRYWMVDQIMSPRYSSFRKDFYTYHRFGIDRLADNPTEASDTALSILPDLKTVYMENNASILLQAYFNAKSNEFMSLISNAPKDKKSGYIEIISSIDVANASKYRDIK